MGKENPPADEEQEEAKEETGEEEATSKTDIQSPKIVPVQFEQTKLDKNIPILTGLPNGAIIKGKKYQGICWLISTIQLIFGMKEFMQSLFRSWEGVNDEEYPISTALISIWHALGYNEYEVAVRNTKLSLLRKFRDLLAKRNKTILNLIEVEYKGKKFDKLSPVKRDVIHLDPILAYETIIDLLKKEFKDNEMFKLMPEHHVYISIAEYTPGQTIYDLIDAAISSGVCPPSFGTPSKYFVLYYEGKPLIFDLVQPESLKMAKYFPQDNNDTSYKLIGLICHCSEEVSKGHFVAYRLIGDKWYFFDDEDVREIEVYVIGNVYRWEGTNETNCLAFYEQI